MQTRLDQGTLNWVKQEIDETLNRARQALEEYVESPDDDAQLRFCQGYLHQIGGSLQMVELYGAALLTEEMESLCGRLLDEGISQKEDAYEVLMRGILQLPTYLERIQGGLTDDPIVLLPLLNDLRAVRGENLLSENALFAPDLTVAEPVMDGAREPAGDVVTLARSQRHRFQLGLVEYLRGRNEDAALEKLEAALGQLESGGGSDEVARIWWVAKGMVEALRTGILAPNASIKRLLGQVDREIKRLIDVGEQGLAADPPTELLKNLLYYAVRAETETPRIKQIKEKFRLGGAIVSEADLEQARGQLQAPDASMMATVAQAIREDLSKIKDALDLFLRGDRSLDVLTEQSEALRRVADTLGMLGMGASRQVVQEQGKALARYAAGDADASEQRLMEVAGALLYVESSLQAAVEGHARPHQATADETAMNATLDQMVDGEFRQVIHKVLEEVRAQMGRAKDAVVAFIDAPWDHALLKDVPAIFDQARGALSMTSLNQPAYLMEAVNRYIRQELLAKQKQPPESELDHFADAVTGIEYFLEAVQEHRGEAALSVLEMVRQRLNELGMTPESEPEDATTEAESTEVLESDGTSAPESDMEKTELASEESEAAQDTATTQSVDVDEALEERVSESVGFIAQPTDEAVHEDPDTAREPVGFAQDSSASSLVEADPTLSDSEAVPLDSAAQQSQVVPVDDDDAVEVEEDNAPESPTMAVDEIDELSETVALPSDPLEASPAVTDTAPPVIAPSTDLDIDDDILEIFIEEAREELEAIGEHYPLWREDPQNKDLLSRIRRAFHTLKGSGRLVGAADIGEFAWSQENLLNRVLDDTVPPSEAVFDLLAKVVDTMPALLDALEQRRGHEVDYMPVQQAAFELVDAAKSGADLTAPMLQDIEADSTSEREATDADEYPPEMDSTLYDIFSKESVTHLQDVEAFLHDCDADDEHCVVSESLVRALHTLHGSARMAGAESIAELGGLLERYVKTLLANEHSLPHEGRVVMGQGIGAIQAMLQDLQSSDEAADYSELTGAIRALYEAEHAQLEERLREEQRAAMEVLDDQDESYNEYDPELIDVFLEEGAEIMDATEGLVEKLANDPSDRPIIEDLQRQLHTLKGGARMSGVTAIGDLAHSIESLLAAVTEGQAELSADSVALLRHASDRLYAMLERVQERRPVEPEQALVDAIHADQLKGISEGSEQTQEQTETVVEFPVDESEEESESAEVVESPAIEAEEERLAEVVPIKGEAPSGVDTTTSEATMPPASQQQGLAQDTVRVRSDLLDRLVNNAGEVSIYRSRLEQHIGSVDFNLVELDQTVTRLREQLRKLEIETEAQILYRYEQSGEADPDFDPLEMDRYSHVQQLSRALMESVSDISSIKDLLEHVVSESETLLLQQARVTTDLQESLMRTRMVPFSGLVPRMRRIVRQTAKELDKQAELKVAGDTGEIDRTLLDRVQAPLEHMMRNAISHGIESAERRRALGKPETGTIMLSAHRDGSEIVVEVSDDGAGMDIEAIKRKAIERDLMDESSNLTDHDILQFILESGFSTAKEVTQISGRGVGMDVVNSQIKQLGGSLQIDSVSDRGTTFTMRLPFTLAVNRALLAKVGEETYSVPLTSIEGIVRLTRRELEAFRSDPEQRYSYAGRDYQVQHLGLLLGVSSGELVPGMEIFPILLVRSGDHRMALQVDSLMGSREIVVKSVGPQLSTIRGLSGATILGDGSVVLILDVGALIRMSAAVRVAPELARAAERIEPVQQNTTVMVVDDSITVRKVTSRLLQRNGMAVLTAKDGVDAVAQLQDVVPDIMLLDIEMPRMDGFELATHIRNEPRLKHIPLIMITSRTGDKHRKRAENIGVDQYLGKPFQESDLLGNIEALLRARSDDT